jgi:electron transport complex protein RnfB
VNEVLIYAVGSLGAIGIVAAVILFFVAQKFKVYEDPRIDEVEEALPSANCGGCGYAGCRAFAEGMVKAGNMEGFNCPVGGADVMQQVASILGLVADVTEPMIAVIRCNGSLLNSPKKVEYDGIATCASASVLYAGDGGCSFGCLGLADCVVSCDFDAIHMNPETGLPEVNNNCTACGACVKACPRDIIELRNVGKKERRIFVSCINEEKGAPAKKNCTVACIGCSKCFNVCPFEAIEMKNNRAYIDYDKCKLCRKCVPVCPTDAIHEINFPLKKLIVKEEKAVETSAETVSAKTPATEKQDEVNKTEES